MDSPSNPARRAVVDVGTNSVKLLVGDVLGASVCPVLETSEQTRLGAGFYTTRQLQPEAIARTAAAARHFLQLARDRGATSVRLIATSAARDARNAHQLADAILAHTGLALEILSGEQEADWVCRGVSTNPALADHSMVVIDAGGGSTEFVVGSPGHVRCRTSFELGTLRYLEQHPVQDPPSAADRAHCTETLDALFTTRILPALEPHLRDADASWCAVGASGTATILARLEHRTDSYDRGLLENTLLTRAAVADWSNRLWSASHLERCQVPGLPAERADVILPGVAIYAAALRHLRLPALHITLRGVRFAALLEPAA